MFRSRKAVDLLRGARCEDGREEEVEEGEGEEGEGGGGEQNARLVLAHRLSQKL